jgi:predicted DsbA family dithiol-disulfide isomerase
MTSTPTITYYLDVVSSWCLYANRTWAELKKRYEGRVGFEWRISLIQPDDFPASEEQEKWFYRRSGLIMHSPVMLKTTWLETENKGPWRYVTPNLVAEAGRDLGINDDRLHVALNRAALLEGRRVADMAEAVSIGAAAVGLDPTVLRAKAESAEIRQRVEASTAEFLSHKITQRPAFILQDPIGDKAVFSGLVTLEPLVATLDAMLFDTAAYASHKAHFGTPPAA